MGKVNGGAGAGGPGERVCDRTQNQGDIKQRAMQRRCKRQQCVREGPADTGQGVSLCWKKGDECGARRSGPVKAAHSRGGRVDLKGT